MQANKAALSASVSSQTESIRSGLERVTNSQAILVKLQDHFRVRPPLPVLPVWPHVHARARSVAILAYGASPSEQKVFR